MTAGLTLDVLTRHFAAGVEHDIGIRHWLVHTISLPSRETLRNLLAAAAGGTATILGLVVSISLLAWQMTADRYRSSGIVAFLLRDRFGMAVTQLLAIGFAYSLWVLALLSVTGHPPYVSAFIALMAATAAVLSLISYRATALAGYIPRDIASRIRIEVISEVSRAARHASGASIGDYSRRVAAADLGILKALLERLLKEDGDTNDIITVIDQAGQLLRGYLHLKPRLQTDSLFFERHAERLSTNLTTDIEEHVAVRGLMDPTTQVTDHMWLERRALEVIRLAVDSVQGSDTRVVQSASEALLLGLQFAWLIEDDATLDLMLEEVTHLAAQPRLRSTPELTEQLFTVPWALVELAGQGFTTTAAAIVQAEPWSRRLRSKHLPWRAQEDARNVALKVRNEKAIAGHRVTPSEIIELELAHARTYRLEQLREKYLNWTIAFCATQLTAADTERAPGGVAAARMTLRVLLRMQLHELPLPEIGQLASQIANIGAHSGKEADLSDVRQDSGRAARYFAETKNWPQAESLLRTSASLGLLEASQQTDAFRTSLALMNVVVTAALVYAWGEFHQWDRRLAATESYVQTPFVDIDRLEDAISSHLLFDLIQPNFIAYHQWTQSLMNAVNELPDRWVNRGGIGLSVEKAHPSSLISRHGMMFGPETCLTHLVEAAIDHRAALREQLVKTLRQVETTRNS